MNRPLLRGLAVAVSAGAVIAIGAPNALASDEGRRHQQVVVVRGDGSAVHLSDTHVHAGSIQFRVRSTNPSTPDGGGSSITMFRTKGGATVQQVLADAEEEFGANPAQGTKDLLRDATFFGLADVTPGTPATVTENLSPGTYYVLDTGNTPTGTPAVTTLTVDGHRSGVVQESDVHSQVTVKTVEPEKFVAPRSWPHEGTFTFANRSQTLHFVAIEPVTAGTTDAQIQAYFDSGSQQPPPFVDESRPGVGADVLSPGGRLQLSYDLPKGTYVLLCFVADEETGMPHALMGMHEVVVLT